MKLLLLGGTRFVGRHFAWVQADPDGRAPEKARGR